MRGHWGAPKLIFQGELEDLPPAPDRGPDFTIEVNSAGLTMIRCHRMLTPESLAELRDKLDRLTPGEGRSNDGNGTGCPA